MGMELSRTFVIGLILFQVMLTILLLFGVHLFDTEFVTTTKKSLEFHERIAWLFM